MIPGSAPLPADQPLIARPVNVEVVGSKEVVAGGHVFAPVVMGAGEQRRVIKLSQREARFVSRFVATGNIELASLEIGLTEKLGKRWLKRTAVQAYLREMLEQRALAQGLTLDKLMATLSKGIDGDLDLSTSQRDCLKIAAKVLKPSIMSLQVNTQINNGASAAAPSPYAKLTPDELAAQWRERLADQRPGASS